MYATKQTKKSDPVDMANSLQELCQPKKVDLLQRGRLCRIVNNSPIVKGSLGSNSG